MNSEHAKAIARTIISGLSMTVFLKDEFLLAHAEHTFVCNTLNGLLAFIKKGDLLKIIHDTLITNGESAYGVLVNSETLTANHLNCPQIFAYALHHNTFSRDAEVLITYDRGYTRESFIEDECPMPDSLPQKMLDNLLTIHEKPIVPQHRDDCCLDDECFERH